MSSIAYVGQRQSKLVVVPYTTFHLVDIMTATGFPTTFTAYFPNSGPQGSQKPSDQHIVPLTPSSAPTGGQYC